MHRLLSVRLAGLVFLMLPVVASGQRLVHNPPVFMASGDGATIPFQFAGASQQVVMEAAVFYRFQGEFAYRRIRATATADGFTAILPPIPRSAGVIEYYLLAELINGSILNLPTINPADNPFRVTIVDPEQPGPIETVVGDIGFRIMSPLPGQPMPTDDLLIAVALFPQSELASADSVRLLINGLDVTHEAQVTPYLVAYIPTIMPVGTYTAEVMYRYGGRSRSVTKWSFRVVEAGTLGDPDAARRTWVNGDVELLARAQSLGGNSNDFTRGSTNLYGSQGSFQYGANGLLTSQENARLQPQNRYGAYVRASHYLNVEGGHVYPDMNPLMLAGRRVFGINARSSLLWRMLNVQVVAGEMNRRIPTLYSPLEERIEVVDFGGTTFTDTTYVLAFRPGGTGTYRRDILAGRLALGSGRYAQFGVNVLKVKDKVGSIVVVDSLGDPAAEAYLSSLSAAQRDWLNRNPRAFFADLTNPTPQDNLVAGADFRLNLHRNRIQFATDAAVSALNNDISAGPLTQKYVDDLGFTIDSEILDRVDKLSWLLVINENMANFPIRFRNDEAEVFIPKGIFAYQSRVGLNYFDHNLSVQYRWIGPDFVSLANNGIRRDVAGYSVSDRFRLLRNTVYMNLQVENLWDNLANQLPARTTTTNYNMSVGWYPVDFRLPRVNLTLRRQFRDNGIAPQNGLIDPARLSAAVRHIRVESFSPDTVVTTLATPRENRTWQVGTGISRQFNLFDMVHDVTLNLTSIRTEDVHFRYGDFYTQSYSLGVVSDLNTVPLRASLNMGYTNADAQSGYTTLNLFNVLAGGRYVLFDEDLILTAEIGIVSAKTVDTQLIIDDSGTPNMPFDDYFRPDPSTRERARSVNYQGSAGAEFRFLDRHAIALSASYTSIQVRSVTSPVPPNDYYLQFRYIYQF